MTLVQAEVPLDLLSAKLRSALRDHFGYRDFRPDQERIIRLLLEGRDALAVLPTGAGKSLVYQLAAQLLPGITIVVSPLIALTATATPWVRRDIVQRLGLRAPAVVVQGVDRPNLFLDVLRVETEAEEARLLRALLGRGEAGSVGGTAAPEPDDDLAPLGDGSGIVYTATTRAAVETARWLRQWGIAADYYHGKRKSADRERVQEAFMAGSLRVIAATNAFGLGVDKADVRLVIHRDAPPTLGDYWQE